ncbi:MAG: iron-sulfur cluster repair di-iron protein [Candidatus Solibacter sp.]|nr:iron-sulfur cluster repair di-iron protein [Candidatus Solibacter sp.]
MTTTTTDRTVGQTAAEFPASVRVFEKHGIDFCCGGKIPVSEACAAKGVDPAIVLAEIEQAIQTPAEDPTDWLTAPLPALMDHILDTHHAYMKRQLPLVEARLAKVLGAHGDRHGEMLRAVSAVYGAMKAELDGHLAKEEMVLFPLVRALDGGAQAGSFHCGSVRNPIRVMWMEHDSAGEALEHLRRLTDNYAAPEDACNTFRALYFELAEMERDLHRHIHLENNILFPRAIALE